MKNRLPKSLSCLEVVGLGVAGHLGWVGTAPIIQEALGVNSLLIWIPASILSMIFVLQIKGLAAYYNKDSGGTPIYGTKLFSSYPNLGKYFAYGYYSAWVTAPTLYSLVLVDLLSSNLDPIGIYLPLFITRLVFTILAYVIGLSGFKALSILHSLLAIPCIVLLIDYFIEGILPALNVPLIFNTSITFIEWCKYYFLATYTVYFCETTGAFVPEVKNKQKALQFFNYAAMLIPIIFVGCSFVMLQLNEVSTTNLYENLYASSIFWKGNRALYSATLIAGCCLVSCGTAVALSSRILYQLSLDSKIPKEFSYITLSGAIPYSTFAGLIIAIVSLCLTNVEDLIIVTATSSILSVYSIQLGIWINKIPNTFRLISLPLFFVQLIIFFVGGISWGLDKFLIGLFFPYVFELFNFTLSKIKIHKPINDLYRNRDPLPLQMITLIIVLFLTVILTWNLRQLLIGASQDNLDVILVVFVNVILFIGIGIACWTSFKQISYLKNSKEHVEKLIINRTNELKITLEQLKESNRLKDAFIETVSHELKTPLTNMRMAIQMTKISLSRIESTPSLDNYVNILTKECDKEIALVNDLLDLQNLEQGTKNVSLEYVNIQNLIVDVVELFSKKMIEAKQILIIDVPEVEVVLYSNLIDLKRILTELLNNAYKYTPYNNEIKVVVKQKENLLYLEVINYGVVIPEIEKNKIFNKFYRIDKSDKYKRGGTGLGLSLIKELVKHLKGNIKLTLDDDCTRFIVTLPTNGKELK